MFLGVDPKHLVRVPKMAGNFQHRRPVLLQICLHASILPWLRQHPDHALASCHIPLICRDGNFAKSGQNIVQQEPHNCVVVLDSWQGQRAFMAVRELHLCQHRTLNVIPHGAGSVLFGHSLVYFQQTRGVEHDSRLLIRRLLGLLSLPQVWQWIVKTASAFWDITIADSVSIHRCGGSRGSARPLIHIWLMMMHLSEQHHYKHARPNQKNW
mmetsp:Transcript_38069/g.68360  ORF Transcript_38069/g.68360 Transcript_38069/m.68360 type:complete len:211 (-) Transcript_38069:41-673(-)